MKRLLLAPFLLLVFSVSAQTDASLQRRLDAYMDANNRMDVAAILDLAYPKIFTIIPRPTLEEETRKVFDSPEVSAQMDSCRADSVHPSFNVGAGTYAVVDYSFVLRMKFKEEENTNAEEMTTLMSSVMNTTVTYDSSTKTLIVPIKADMLAIRNEHSPDWTFIDYKKLKSLSTMLLDAEVWAKLED